VTKPSKEVSDGYFTVQLDFGSGVFTGDARWLEIAVDCGSGATALGPRQELTAAPYALGLRPGAVISGTNTSGAMLKAINSANSGPGYGVLGQSSSSFGVAGQSDSSYGIYASGGAGDLRLYDGTIYSNMASGSDMELHSNDYIDVHLDDDSDSASQFRVLNDADTAIFTVSESGAVSWQPTTGYVSLPAAAFGPQEDHYDFTNFGGALRNNDGDSDRYYAPVQLPHGATVTGMTWYWYDTSVTTNGAAYLRRGSLTGGLQNAMAQVNTSGSGGDSSGSDTIISYATIDNSQYTYYVAWFLWDSGVSGYTVVIEYTYTGPH